MKIRKSCNCRGGSLNDETWRDFLFYELQQTNILGKSRAIIARNGEIVSTPETTLEFLGVQKVYGLIPVGLKSVSEITIYERPF